MGDQEQSPSRGLRKVRYKLIIFCKLYYNDILRKKAKHYSVKLVLYVMILCGTVMGGARGGSFKLNETPQSATRFIKT